MSRNGSGTYTLPSGNPVVSGTLIEASWANTTLSDLASAMTDSLSRSGQGGMTAALRLFDGTSSVPGLAWGSETTTGWYRAGAGDMRLVVTGSEIMRYQSTGVWITGTLSASGNTTVGGTLGVTGAATLSSTLALTGAATFNSTTQTNGLATFGGRIYLAASAGPTWDTNTYLWAESGFGARYDSFNHRFDVGLTRTLGMVLNSTGNLGIGTSSPNGKLRIQNDNSTIPSLIIRDGGTPAANMIEVSSNATGNALILNASGNLGLGVTPSAWVSSVKAIQLGSGGSVSNWTGGSGAISIGANLYDSGSGIDRYVNTAAAAKFDVGNGSFAWRIAPSGTAGNAISFTQAMTLDASANLALGTSSTGGTFYMLSASGGFNGPAIIGQPGGTTSWQVGTSAGFAGDGSTDLALAASSGRGIRFYTGGNAERARIDSSGRFLIGRTSSNFTSGWTTLAVGNAAALAGPADTNAILCANSYYDGQWKRTTAGFASIVEMLFAGSQVQFFTGNSGAANGVITWAGGPYIANGSNTWTNGSDEKLKNITGEIEDAVAKVMQIRAARYTWKADPENKPQVGLIAQDLQKVLPEVVVEPPEPKDQYGNDTYLGVNYDQVIPLLVGAIKEQQAIINQLKADVAALKGA